jgi:hypothetical protein
LICTFHWCKRRSDGRFPGIQGSASFQATTVSSPRPQLPIGVPPRHHLSKPSLYQACPSTTPSVQAIALSSLSLPSCLPENSESLQPQTWFSVQTTLNSTNDHGLYSQLFSKLSSLKLELPSIPLAIAHHSPGVFPYRRDTYFCP